MSYRVYINMYTVIEKKNLYYIVAYAYNNGPENNEKSWDFSPMSE
jgi:hypothetical protein